MKEKSIKFILPFPPTSNTMFNGGQKSKRRFKSKKYTDWLKICPKLPSLNINNEIKVKYTFAWPDKRRRDGQNFQKAPLDYLVSQNVLEDDYWLIVSGETWGHIGVDKNNPRVEIEITSCKDRT